MPGKKPNPGGRKRDPGVRRQVQAVVRLENDGVWAVAVDEHTGEPKTGKVVRVLEGLSRRKSEEAVAFFLENPSVPLEVVGIVVTPGQPGRRPSRSPDGVRRMAFDNGGRVQADDNDPLTLLIDGEEANLRPIPAKEEEEGADESPATRLKRRKNLVHANTRNVLLRGDGLEGPLFEDGPPCTCRDFWKLWIDHRREPSAAGSHPPCSICGKPGEEHFRSGAQTLCETCFAGVESPPPHRHCTICRAAAQDGDPAVQVFAWVHPITMEREVRGWVCFRCRAGFQPPPPSWRTESEG